MTGARFLVAIALLACCASPAVAGWCEVKDYAQYKDATRSRFQRTLMALQYCTNARLMKTGLPPRDQAECSTAQSRMIDALDASDSEVALWARIDCPKDKSPPPDGKG